MYLSQRSSNRNYIEDLSSDPGGLPLVFGSAQATDTILSTYKDHDSPIQTQLMMKWRNVVCVFEFAQGMNQILNAQDPHQMLLIMQLMAYMVLGLDREEQYEAWNVKTGFICTHDTYVMQLDVF